MTVASGYGYTVDGGKLSAPASGLAAGTETAISAQPARSPASRQPPSRREQARLLSASFVMLFVELALIRWVAPVAFCGEAEAGRPGPVPMPHVAP